jgi:peptidoglycan hydrolase-like protein with peptidoglycan-binding domain
MAIYTTEQAAQNALVQEATFYPEDQPPLSSVLFRNNRNLLLINMGKASSIGLEKANNSEAVRLLHIALFTIIPEIDGVNTIAKNNALGLKLSDGSFPRVFSAVTESLVLYFQQSTPELAGAADGLVGRKTIYELDKALNRIGGYDAVNGGTIINYGLSENINADTVVYQINSSYGYVPLYDKPLAQDENIILKLNKDDIVHVVRKHPDATAAGWYQVIVLSADMATQDDEGKQRLKDAYNDSISIEGHIQAAYIWEYWEDDGSQVKAPMPDIYSKLYRIPALPAGEDIEVFSNQQLRNIIQTNYYDEVKIYPLNADGEAFVPSDPSQIITFPSRGTIDNNEINTEPFFLFCLNLLIYANNPIPGDTTNRSIYPNNDIANGNTKDFYSKTDTEDAHEILESLLENGTAPNDLYAHFTSVIKNVSADYDYIDTGAVINKKLKVLLRATNQYHMWIPSRQCAESLWRLVNNKYTQELPASDPIVELAKVAVKTLFPARSFGARLKVNIGATIGFIGGDFEGDLSIWRQDTEDEDVHILKISAFGQIGLGADVGVEAGFGFWLGGNNRKKEKRGIGAAAGASVQAGGVVNALVEFEIPITGKDPVSRGLAAMMYSSVGVLLPIAAPFAFSRAIENYNLDIWNYMTKLKVYGGVQGQAGAMASAGLKFGKDTEEDKFGNGTANSKSLKPTILSSLISKAAKKGAINAGISVGAEFGFGFDIDVKYYVGDQYQKCMRDDGTRVPLEIKVFAFGEGGAHFEFFTSLSLGLFGIPILPGVLLQQGLGIKMGIIYDITQEPDVVNNDTSNYEFSFGKMLKNGKKLISLYNFSGDLDRYLEYGYENTFNFNLDSLVETFTSGVDPATILPGGSTNLGYDFGQTLTQVLNQLDGAEFKKRFGLGYKRRGYKSLQRAQRIIGERWYSAKLKHMGRNSKFKGLASFQSYIDLNYTIKGEDYIKAIKALIMMVRVGVAHNTAQDNTELNTLNQVLDEFTSNEKTNDEKIDYAVSLYSDTALETILNTHAEAGDVFSHIFSLICVEIGNRSGFYKSNKPSLSNMNPKFFSVARTMVINYVTKWENINIALHSELSFAFAVGGSLGLGAKVRAFLGVEAAIVSHSDFIKDDYVYLDSFWSKIIQKLLSITPVNSMTNQLLTEAEKQKLIQFVFDKQL